ncbi:MAG TPA: hypothetical protein VN493_14730 [Thermoanaerobaculia bacterium]|nr:hypothetical protein [Thermoanaerobaculia bacterium]
MRTPRPAAILIALLLIALPAFAGEGRWTPIGPPRVGPFLDLVVDPTDPSTLYAISFGESASGLWKSVDSGRRWVSINAGIPNSYTWSLDVDPLAPDTLYALGSSEDLQVLFKSLDGGGTWMWMHQRSSADVPIFEELVADPFVKGRLYARSDTMVWRSDDGGGAWSIVGRAGESASAMRLLTDPANPGTLYLTVGTRLWRSTDSGEAWVVLHESSEELELLAVGSEPSAVYVAAQATCSRLDEDGTATDLLLSDPGESCVDLAVSPVDPRSLYLLSDRGRIYHSTDAGMTWAAIHGGAPKPGLGFRRPLRVDFETGALYLLGEQGVFKSADGGGTWQSTNRGFTTATLSVLLSTGGKRGAIYAAPRGEPLMRTRNGGLAWVDLGIGPVTALAADPSSPQHLFASPVPEWGRRPRVYESHDQGGTWSPLGSLPFYETITRLAVNPANPKVVYAGTSFTGIYKSTNGGRTWSKASRGLPFPPPCDRSFCSEEPVAAIEIDPRDPRLLYAVFNYQVVRSTDGGKSWDLAMEGLDGEIYVETLILDPERPNVLYIGTREGVFKSTDRGDTWQESSFGLPEAEPFGDFSVLDLAIDTRGSETVLYAATRVDGVFRSTDRGATWQPVDEGLPILMVDFVEIDWRHPRGALAGTSGAAVWSARFE